MSSSRQATREGKSLTDISLDDKYLVRDGRVYLNGVQALVRLVLEQRRRDQSAGLNTAGFISGYRGSPLGTLDQQLWKAGHHLAAHHVHFEPGLNEELAATAVWGSQQTNLFPGAKYDGVFAMWYGKAPGVDRAGDAFKHGNAAGTSPHGGVLVLLGDDHNCKSASLPSQSEYACADALIPVLNPSGITDLIEFGLLGWALSRFSGSWVGLKCLIDTMDASASIEVSTRQAVPVYPEGFVLPPDGLNIRWPDPPLDQERRQHTHRMAAIRAFARCNRFDRVAIDPRKNKRLGVVATGKSYLDVRQALHELGLTAQVAADIGIGLYKVGMNWPLETDGIRRFAAGFEKVIVVEEKRPLIEDQLSRALYDLPDDLRPRLLGKLDEGSALLFNSAGELTATQIAVELGRRIAGWHEHGDLPARLAVLEQRHLPAQERVLPRRLPHFCPGCPHNTSTVVPEGSHALAGIGCHYMAQWMDRRTETFTQMGAEGTSWIGQFPFTDANHVFANIGDGTFAHSGSLAIRASIAAGVNVTYKLLYNAAVAMTGGQPAEGCLSVPKVVKMLEAEGVAAIRVVVHGEHDYEASDLPPTVPVFERDKLDSLQRELRAIPGVTVLIYDQTCALEQRRRRKRQQVPAVSRHIMINEHVCEGCGDCGLQSNCVAIAPLETELGRKRQIDQSACNLDFSCLRGFCPSFVTVVGGELTAREPLDEIADASEIPAPRLPELDEPYGILIAGIGGTGVVTIGALVGMAAHIERKGVSVIDMIGLSQKGGPVLSQLRLARSPEDIMATRISPGGASLLLGCDLIVAADPDTLALLDAASAHAVINHHATMPAEFTRDPDLGFPGNRLRGAITDLIEGSRTGFIDATVAASRVLGDAIYANVFLLGYAWQKGLIPLRYESLIRAIELNGSAIEKNRVALNWGRYAAHVPSFAEELSPELPVPRYRAGAQGVRELIARRVKLLTDYQDSTYANRYESLALRVLDAEMQRAGGKQGIAVAVAHNLHRIMAYKDEYEVARLFVRSDFYQRVDDTFRGNYSLRYHLAPPIFARRDPHTGRPRKREFGPWIKPVFRCLASLRRLRGTPLDIFGYTGERRMERRLVRAYTEIVEELIAGLTPDNYDPALQLAKIPEEIRGFGPVKEAAAAKAERRQADLLAAFRQSERPSADVVVG